MKQRAACFLVFGLCWFASWGQSEVVTSAPVSQLVRPIAPNYGSYDFHANASATKVEIKKYELDDSGNWISLDGKADYFEVTLKDGLLQTTTRIQFEESPKEVFIDYRDSTDIVEFTHFIDKDITSEKHTLKSYNDHGDCIEEKITENDSIISHRKFHIAYDTQGRWITSGEYGKNGSLSYWTEVHYSDVGLISKQTMFGPDSLPTDHRVFYNFDDTACTSFYIANGNQMTLWDSLAIVLDRTTNTRKRLTYSAPTFELAHESHELLDEAGNVLTTKWRNWTMDDFQEIQTYEYNNEGLLIKETGYDTYSKTYVYDTYGNWVEEIHERSNQPSIKTVRRIEYLP